MDMEPAGLSPAAEWNAPGWTTDCHTSDVGHWFAMTCFLVRFFYLNSLLTGVLVTKKRRKDESFRRFQFLSYRWL